MAEREFALPDVAMELPSYVPDDYWDRGAGPSSAHPFGVEVDKKLSQMYNVRQRRLLKYDIFNKSFVLMPRFGLNFPRCRNHDNSFNSFNNSRRLSSRSSGLWSSPVCSRRLSSRLVYSRRLSSSLVCSQWLRDSDRVSCAPGDSRQVSCALGVSRQVSYSLGDSRRVSRPSSNLNLFKFYFSVVESFLSFGSGWWSSLRVEENSHAIQLSVKPRSPLAYLGNIFSMQHKICKD